jgi:hypothetical protein
MSTVSEQHHGVPLKKKKCEVCIRRRERKRGKEGELRI